jgi:hypothetical protein
MRELLQSDPMANYRQIESPIEGPGWPSPPTDSRIATSR